MTAVAQVRPQTDSRCRPGIGDVGPRPTFRRFWRSLRGGCEARWHVCSPASPTHCPTRRPVGGMSDRPCHLRPDRGVRGPFGRDVPSSSSVGDGPRRGDAFERGTAALREWVAHRGSGLTVLADGPLAVGTNVAMAAPLPVGFVEVTCRVVDVIDEPEAFGFAYGTLSTHPERGEESFVVRRAADGTVRFVVAAASEPAHPLARLAAPIANRLQDRACRRYLSAMERSVG